MARWTAKEIVLPISTTNEAIIFLEAIQKQIKTVDIIADYYPGKVTIRFEGAKENLKNALEYTKDIHLMVREMLYPDDNETYAYNLDFLVKITGITIPNKTLIRILNFQDYSSKKTENTLISTIKYDHLIKLIEKINTTLNNMPYEVATTSLRDVLTTIVVLKDVTIEEAISLAKKAEVIKEDDLKRLQLEMEPEQAIEICLKKA